MLDICSVNSFLIWKIIKSEVGHRNHRQFRSAVAQGRLHTLYLEESLSTKDDYPSNRLPPVSTNALSHNWKRFDRRRYCVWCKAHSKEWVPKRPPVLTEIVNGATPVTRKRQSQSWGGCEGCKVYLCQKGSCLEEFHSQKQQE
jgi:hypothetical protein